MKDILDICKTQVGTREGSGGKTKYGSWLDSVLKLKIFADADWCGSSLMWCVAQLGPEFSSAAGGVDKDFAYVQNWYDWFRKHGRVSHTAKSRRLVWYDWAGTPPGANHVGLVASVSGSTMRVYEGNHNNEFQLVTRKIDSQVMGFGEWWSYVNEPSPLITGGGTDCWMG